MDISLSHHLPNTAVDSSFGLRESFARHLNLIVPVCVVGAVLVVVVPLPPGLMDLLLAANITASLVILLTTIQIGSPREFSLFPSILLGTTLIRLVLNIGTTRLILSGAGDRGERAAGDVIAGFGDFVAAGSPLIGLIMFSILVLIQFLVITKGATRISEVAARFALDGMPGRQMAIDADLSAGAISPDEAKELRGQLVQQSDFYGAMDGAGKFVRGDAVAGVIITLINIVGGLCVGVFQHGMSLGEAAGVFTTLAIGDGLASQLPALLIAVAAGVLVTRTSVHSDLPREVIGQTFAHPTVLYMAACLLSILAFTGLPAVPLLVLASLCGAIGWMLDQTDSHTQTPVDETAKVATSSSPVSTPNPTSMAPLQPEPIALELGLGLLRLTNSQAGGDLLSRIRLLRERTAREMGYVLPKIRVRDNLHIGLQEFQITLHSVPVLRAEIASQDRDESADDNHPMEYAADAVISQLESTIRSHSHELLTRQQVHQLLDQLRQSSPGLVDDVVPHLLKVGQIHQVLISLLREDVPIRNFETLLEAIACAAEGTHDIEQLTEAARQSLSRIICRRHCDAESRLPAITLDPLGEAALADSILGGGSSMTFDSTSPGVSVLQDRLESVLRSHSTDQVRPVLVCRTDLRAALRNLCQDRLPGLAVLGRREITPDVRLDIVAEIGQEILNDRFSLVAA